MSLSGSSGVTADRVRALQSGAKERVTYNVVQSVIDTVTARIAETKPKPYFLTSGGDYKVQRKAKKLNQFVEGMFYEQKAYDLGPMVFRDGAIWGDGIVHVFEKNGRVAYERVLAHELYVDEVEAQYGKPRQMHRVKYVDRDVLASIWPEKKKLIEGANRATVDKVSSQERTSDVLVLRASWHLPSGPDSGDGRCIISIEDGVLESYEWDHDFFPFARLPWCPRPLGYWSQGLSEQIQNVQLEINKLLWIIQRSYHLAGMPRVFLENGSKVVKEHINNDVGAIINYTGTAPIFHVAQPVHPDIYQQLATLINRAYEQAGVSQLGAASRKPEGLNSGKALREYQDIQSDRFRTIARFNEQFYLELAKLSIAVAKDIAKENKGHYEVTVPGRKFLQSIDWADIDLEDDEYVMQCFPVSSLPNDPAGRLQTIQEYIQAGFLTPRQGRRLLDFPDLEQVESLANAMEDLVTEVLDKICDDGDYTPPEPTWDLAMCKELVLEYQAKAQILGLEEERLDLLSQWSSQVDWLTSQAMAAAMPPPAAIPGAAPQAIAAPPPVSDLLPNAPGIAPV